MLTSLDPAAAFGAALAALRRRSGKTLTGVAARIGLTESTVGRFERGIQRPSSRSLRRYLVAVGSNVHELDEMLGLMGFFRQVHAAKEDIILESLPDTAPAEPSGP